VYVRVLMPMKQLMRSPRVLMRDRYHGCLHRQASYINCFFTQGHEPDKLGTGYEVV